MIKQCCVIFLRCPKDRTKHLSPTERFAVVMVCRNPTHLDVSNMTEELSSNYLWKMPTFWEKMKNDGFLVTFSCCTPIKPQMCNTTQFNTFSKCVVAYKWIKVTKQAWMWVQQQSSTLSCQTPTAPAAMRDCIILPWANTLHLFLCRFSCIYLFIYCIFLPNMWCNVMWWCHPIYFGHVGIYKTKNTEQSEVSWG